MTTLLDLANLVGGSVVGDPDFAITGIRELHRAGPTDLSFFTNQRYRQAFLESKAGAVLVAQECPDAPLNQIVCKDPYLAMAQIASKLFPEPTFPAGIHASACVDDTAIIHPSVHIGPNAVIMPGARIGDNSVIHAQGFVGNDCSIGTDCRIGPGVKILDRSQIGNRVIIHAGAIIGSDGFGFAPDQTGARHKIPQVGHVEIEDDCEIGANTTIDRATLGRTRIGAGTKLDNLVQIAHNVSLGNHCVMASQSGIAGSSSLGDRVIMGAQSGVSGHVSICDDTVLAARAGVISDITEPGVYAGFPTMAHRDWLKYKAQRRKLVDMRRTLAKHDRAIAQIKTTSE